MEIGIPITLLFSIIGVLISAVVAMLWGKIKDLIKEIEELKKAEVKNYSFRHNFDTVTKGLMSHFENRIENLEKLMESKFEIIIKTLQAQSR